jgi:WD40 repeat protein
MNIRLKHTSSKLLTCSFSQNGKYIVCGDNKGVISIWNSDNKNTIFNFIKLHDSSVNHLLFHSNFLYTASSDGKCKILDLKSYKNVRTFDAMDHISIFDIDCFDEVIITVNNMGKINFWDKRIKNPIESISHGFNIKTAKFLFRSFLIVIAGILSEIIIWDFRKIQKQKIEKCIINKKSMQLNSLTVSKNRQSLFLSDITNNFFQYYFDQINKSVEYRKIQKNFFKFKNKSTTFLKTSSDMKNKFFGYGDNNGMIHILSQENGKLLYNHREHIGNINCIDFHPVNHIFSSCGDDKSLVIRTFFPGNDYN